MYSHTIQDYDFKNFKKRGGTDSDGRHIRLIQDNIILKNGEPRIILCSVSAPLLTRQCQPLYYWKDTGQAYGHSLPPIENI